MARFTNDPYLTALDDIRRMASRIEMELQDNNPNPETIKAAARTAKVQLHRFTRFKGF